MKKGDTGENTSKIKRISTRLYAVFIAFLILIPALTAGFWLFYNLLPADIIVMSVNLPKDTPLPEILTLQQRLMGLAVSLVPLAIKMTALLTILRLLKLYRSGSVFSGAHVNCFKKLGRSLIYITVAGIVQTPALGLVLTMNNPPGQRVLTLGAGSEDIRLFVVAAIVLMLSWIMDEARILAEDQALTV